MDPTDNVLMYGLVMVTILGVFAVGAFIGDYIIPALVESIKGTPQPKQRIDYARKDWIKTLTSYEH